MRDVNPVANSGFTLQQNGIGRHPEFSSSGPVGPTSFMQPNIGLSGFAQQLFSQDGGLTPWGADVRMEQLRRAQIRQKAVAAVLSTLLCLVCVMYFTEQEAEAPLRDEYFDNATEKIGLDFSPSHGYGLCMGKADQSFTVFMNGKVVANGNSCNMRFVGTNPRAPECEENMKNHDLWLAVEVQDSEEDSRRDTSILAFAARLEWW
jgi:hypothetical protein